MKTSCMPFNALSNIKLMLLFILLNLFCSSCSNKLTFDQLADAGSISPEYLSDTAHQLVIWMKPGQSMSDVSDKINSIKNKYGDIRIAKICKDCDSSLMLLVGPGADAYINAQGQTVRGGGGTGKPGAGGDDGPIFFSGNFHIMSEDSADICQHNKETPNEYNACKAEPMPANSTTRDPVVVAVLDTGIDTTGIGKYMYKSDETVIGHNSKTEMNSCIGPNANNGWAFVPQSVPTISYPWFDDHPSKHGTIVSHLILNQVLQSGGNSIRLLPVKVLDKDGKGGRLYDFLCALQYSKNRGAKIINASLGFYSVFPNQPDTHPYPAADLLNAYIQNTLTANNILLICAAGNQFKHEYNTRSLDTISFYPASLSRNLQNVFAVTTVSKIAGDVSHVQNYSEHVIDLGVDDDQNILERYLFWNPLNAGHTVNGSSFATPKVSGTLCSNYDLVQSLISSGPLNKAQLINNIQSQRNVIEQIPSFSAHFINGGMILKSAPR